MTADLAVYGDKYYFFSHLTIEEKMNLYHLIVIPVISALIGWITNFLAVKMIFRPYKEISILGFKLQGLLPKRKSDLAEKIGETVEKELISHDDIKKAVDNPEFHKELTQSVMVGIEKVIKEKLGANPMVAMFLSGETMEMIMGMLSDEIENQVPEFMESMFEKMESKIDFKELVRNKVNDFDMLKLEEIVYDIAAKELKAIEVFGAVLGALVGVVQVALIPLLAQAGA